MAAGFAAAALLLLTGFVLPCSILFRIAPRCLVVRACLRALAACNACGIAAGGSEGALFALLLGKKRD